MVQGKLAVSHAVVQSRKVAERRSTRRERNFVDRMTLEKSMRIGDANVGEFDENSSTQQRDDDGGRKRTLKVRNIFREKKSRNEILLPNGHQLKQNNLYANASELRSSSTVFSVTPTSVLDDCTPPAITTAASVADETTTATTATSTSTSVVCVGTTVVNTPTYASDMCSIAKVNSSSSSEILVIDN